MEQVFQIGGVLFLILVAGVVVALWLSGREKKPTSEMKAEWKAREERDARRLAYALEVTRVGEIIDAAKDGSDEQARAIALMKGLRVSHRKWGYIIIHADHNGKPKLKQIALDMQLAIAEGTVTPHEFSGSTG